MKERDPSKNQHPELLIAGGIIALGVILVGAIFAITQLFGLIFKSIL